MKNLSISSKIVAITVFAIFSLLYNQLFAQSSRNVSVSGFASVGVSSGINLFLTQSNTESVIIKGDEDVIKDVVVEKKDGNLNIKYKDGVNWSRLFKGKVINVYVTFKNLSAIAASGGSDVETEGVLKTDKISLAASGGSDLDLNVVCKDISVAISGGADLDLKGSAENMKVSASGGSDVNAFDFKVNYAQINISGGSDANVYVNKGLTANATGGSDIKYKGNAALKKVSNSKSADIIHVN